MDKDLTKQEDVRDFLRSVKETIANPVAEQGWVIVPRSENTECILQLGFKYEDIEETLLDLSVEDYCEGPIRDRDQSGELWVFGKAIENRTVYIKIKLASFGPLRIVRIISFHLAERTLQYPLRKAKEDEE